MNGLGAHAWPELEKGSGMLVVPVGATEQHGPHLPLSTDTTIARALASALARRWPHIQVAPAVSYGASGEHADFAGTLSIGRAATELVLVELCRSATASFPRVLLLSTHGGNADPVRRAVRTLRAERRDVRAWGPRWPGDAHAGLVETSVMLALHPASVRTSVAAAGNTASVAELLPRLQAEGVRAVSANGVLGDPAGSSAEHGRALLEQAAGALDRFLADWSAAP